MTNREWVIKEMQNMRTEDLCDLLQDCNLKEYGVKYDTSYGKCMCKWLDAERKEKIKLLEAERVILGNVDKGYKWIARDSTKRLCLYVERPKKGDFVWGGNYCRGMDVFAHLFQFIKWSDTEPYNIEELLGG